MADRFSRTALLLGDDAINKLKTKHVAVFGLGGVGGYVTEALARSGVGKITVTDNDVVSESNINRQIIALTSTVGKKKTELWKERIKDINPEAEVETLDMFVARENADEIDFSAFDLVVDAVDTVTAKLVIIEKAKKAGCKVISAMGTGNKTGPELFEISDVSKTSVCPLARVMRKELKARGITGVKVLYSTEDAVKPAENADVRAENVKRRALVGSLPYVPSVAGLLIAAEAVRELLGEDKG